MQLLGDATVGSGSGGRAQDVDDPGRAFPTDQQGGAVAHVGSKKPWGEAPVVEDGYNALYPQILLKSRCLFIMQHF